MFVRHVTRRVNGKTYRYPQLVESFRKPDGTPAHRVLCTLTSLSPQAITNLTTALEAGRLGQPVALAPDAGDVLQEVGVLANRRYLDVAVAYEQWQQLQLPTVLAPLLAGDAAAGGNAETICALVLHRCTEPGSKLAASRWYPRTALPELQHLAPAHFNNTRVHRALEALERVDADLQARLAPHLCTAQGPFAALFMDITDTWFEGRGPQMAHNSRTKEGLLRHKVGLVLLCDQRGYPVRWQALPGDYYEADVMGQMVERVSTLDWVQQVPVVLDRMMGKASALAELAATGVRFVTALPTTEFESWTHDIPWHALAEVTVAATDNSAKDDLVRVHAALKGTALVKGHDRWLLDLGVVTRPDLGAPRATTGLGALAGALRLAAAMKADLQARLVSVTDLAQREAVSPRAIRGYLELMRLDAALQRRVLAGEAEPLTLGQLRTVARRPHQRQLAAFEALRAHAAPKRSGRRLRLGKPSDGPAVGVTARLVVGFRPEAFIAEHKAAIDTRRELDALVIDLNRRLRSPHSRRTAASIHAELDRFLRARQWLDLFQVIVEGEVTGDYQVQLRRDEQAWARRMRYAGFSLFAAHADLPISAEDLVATYFAKDAVEKDFQTIKSELELRPIRHRTDLKVRAHVTICMLALLLARQLELQLRTAGTPMTAASLFEVLSPVHLNALRIGSTTTYRVTEREPDAAALLKALDMQHLVDDARVAQRILPRAAVVA